MIKDGVELKCDKITSILMIGQSNMAGRGEFSDVEPIKNELCYMLRMGRWQPMSEPINPDRAIWGMQFHSGVSLAASFADELAKHTSSKVGLIPCADGGTKLCQWMPGEILFDHAVMMTQLAMRTSNFGGIIWHQGESDLRCEGANLEDYKKNFIYMMTALRERLNAQNLPIIIGELSENMGEGWNFGDGPKKMNRIFHEIANQLPMCAVASSKGLAMKPDGLHFNAVACREFGKRYFDKYIELIQ